MATEEKAETTYVIITREGLFRAEGGGWSKEYPDAALYPSAAVAIRRAQDFGVAYRVYENYGLASERVVWER